MLAQAVWDGRAVAMTYERSDRAVERVIGPLGLVLKGGVWYIVALTEGGQIRTFRGSRVTTARLRDDAVERPAGFDLANYWTESSSAYERESPTVQVVVRLPADRTWRLADVVGESAVREAERLAVEDPDGWVHLRLRLTWPDEVPGKLLAAGSHLEVLEPPEIRASVIEIAGRVVARYRGDATEGAGGAAWRDEVEAGPA
jgi:predicted DNA-binding transcriptional regulator YafY